MCDSDAESIMSNSDSDAVFDCDSDLVTHDFAVNLRTYES